MEIYSDITRNYRLEKYFWIVWKSEIKDIRVFAKREGPEPNDETKQFIIDLILKPEEDETK